MYLESRDSALSAVSQRSRIRFLVMLTLKDVAVEAGRGDLFDTFDLFFLLNHSLNGHFSCNEDN